MTRALSYRFIELRQCGFLVIERPQTRSFTCKIQGVRRRDVATRYNHSGIYKSSLKRVSSADILRVSRLLLTPVCTLGEFAANYGGTIHHFFSMLIKYRPCNGVKRVTVLWNVKWELGHKRTVKLVFFPLPPINVLGQCSVFSFIFQPFLKHRCGRNLTLLLNQQLLCFLFPLLLFRTTNC